jgi:sec-independent protein translocase protein TatC
MRVHRCAEHGLNARRAAVMARMIKVPVRKFKIPRLPQVDPNTPDVFEEMTLQEHLVELRDRIMKVCIGIGAAFVFGFAFTPTVLRAIANGAGVEEFDMKGPTDGLTLWFKVALYIAIAITLPFTVYQLVAFLAPGLTRKEKRMLYSTLPFIGILFAIGVWYAYYVAAPAALDFLETVMDDLFNWDGIDGAETVAFYVTLMMGLGISFQLPVVMFILAKIGIVTPKKMRQWRKYAFLLIMIASAVITPSTDPINLMLVAIPLTILYEAGILISSIFAKTSLRNPDGEGAGAPA